MSTVSTSVVEGVPSSPSTDFEVLEEFDYLAQFLVRFVSFLDSCLKVIGQGRFLR